MSVKNTSHAGNLTDVLSHVPFFVFTFITLKQFLIGHVGFTDLCWLGSSSYSALDAVRVRFGSSAYSELDVVWVRLGLGSYSVLDAGLVRVRLGSYPERDAVGVRSGPRPDVELYAGRLRRGGRPYS